MKITIPKYKKSYYINKKTSKNSLNYLITLTSLLLFTDKYVYKIKRPIKMRYFDFTSLESRKHYTYQELTINRKFCNGTIYKRVSYLVKDNDNSYSIEDYKKNLKNKTVVEYALKMKRLNPQKSLRAILEIKGTLSDFEIEEITKKISNIHTQALTDEVISSFGDCSTVQYNIMECFDEINNLESKTDFTIPSDFMNIKKIVLDFIGKNEDLFKERVNKGFVRHLHGDLRLDQIFIDNNKVYLIDAIESVPRFYNCDVIEDLAFLLMELEGFGKNNLSNKILDFYQIITNYKVDKDLLLYYKLYRALIRVKINLYKLSDTEIGDNELYKNKAENYLKLALRYSKLIS